MKTLCKTLLVLAVCLSLSSCASYELSYLKSSSPQPKLTKVYILVKDSLAGVQTNFGTNYQDDFMNTLSKNLYNNLLLNGVQDQLNIHSTLYSLDSEEDIKLQIKAYAPDVVMHIKREQSAFVSNRYGTRYNAGTYSVTLSHPGEKRPFWRAIVQSYYESSFQRKDYHALANEIMDKMKADGLI
jgi:hypothetical protein